MLEPLWLSANVALSLSSMGDAAKPRGHTVAAALVTPPLCRNHSTTSFERQIRGVSRKAGARQPRLCAGQCERGRGADPECQLGRDAG